jgi:hypothetical protein
VSRQREPIGFPSWRATYLFPIDPGLNNDRLAIAGLLQEHWPRREVEASQLERKKTAVLRPSAVAIIAHRELDREVAVLAAHPVEEIVAPTGHRIDLPLLPTGRAGWHGCSQVI